ncbi:MAG: hypothetical protein LBE34_06725 [Flavobacteriaceae bacterium]|jgi:hypothetical protein|nr:hypothetical protein [Flavobacteriaceae bacterium]
MRKPKIILDIFFSFLFVITNGTIYGQREISIYEPMYTMDFAKKHHLALGIQVLTDYNYWFIENFKAPEGVKIVVENRPFNSSQYVRTFYVYDTDNKYLNREISHRYNENGVVVANSMFGYTYEYNIQNSILEIEKKELNSQRSIAKYFFDNDNDNFLKLIQVGKDTLRYYYSNTILSNRSIVDSLESSSLKNRINYNVMVFNDIKFSYSTNSFMYISQSSPLYFGELPLKVFEGSKNPEKNAKFQAKKFNSFIKKYVLLGKNQVEINISFSIKPKEQESWNLNTPLKFRGEDFVFWITDNTISSSLNRGYTSFLFDPKTRNVIKECKYTTTILERYYKKPLYIN